MENVCMIIIMVSMAITSILMIGRLVMMLVWYIQDKKEEERRVKEWEEIDRMVVEKAKRKKEEGVW